MQSPVTLTEHVAQEEEFDAAMIRAEYQRHFGYETASYFKGQPKVKLFRCLDTGYRFFYPKELEGDEALYRHLQGFSWYYTAWKWENDYAAKYIRTGDRILDIGCGDGTFLERFSNGNYAAEGLELNEEAVAVARSKGISIHIHYSQSFAKTHRGAYDVVTAFQVLEHVYDVHTFVTSAIDLLKPGGLLIIAVPNNNPYLYRYDKYTALNLPPHHMGMWDKMAVRKMAAFFKLEIESVVAEPLQPGEIMHYYRLSAARFVPQALTGFTSRALASLNNLFKVKREGRNVVAVLRKPMQP